MENENVKNLINMIDKMDIKDKLRLVICMSQDKWSGLIYNTKENYEKFVKEDQMLVMCSKGFEAGSNKTMDEVVQEELPNVKFGVLSGPSHAEEVSTGAPTLLVAVSQEQEIQDMLQEAFMSENMRIYVSDDIRGAELGGALKNIIAFCAGIAAGLGYGDNAFAALITRGLAEIRRLAMEMGAQSNTLYGLSGLGDLVVTCASEHSRNRSAGKLIGQGKTIEEAKAEVGMVIESIDNIEVAKALSEKLNVEMPIVDVVYDVLYNNLDPNEGVKILMTRNRKAED